MKMPSRQGFTLVELMIVVAVIGILAAIAVPNFIKWQARSKQAEAKSGLKGIFQAQRSYFAEQDTYSSGFNQIGHNPERGNRYSYHMGSGEAQRRDSETLVAGTGLTTEIIEIDRYKLGSSLSTGAIGATPVVTAEPGVSTAGAPGVFVGPSGSFIVMASGTIDNDDTWDQWALGGGVSLSVAESPCTDLSNGPAGIPVNTYNDVSCP